MRLDTSRKIVSANGGWTNEEWSKTANGLGKYDENVKQLQTKMEKVMVGEAKRKAAKQIGSQSNDVAETA